jgi:hypothetical protein
MKQADPRTPPPRKRARRSTLEYGSCDSENDMSVGDNNNPDNYTAKAPLRKRSARIEQSSTPTRRSTRRALRQTSSLSPLNVSGGRLKRKKQATPDKKGKEPVRWSPPESELSDIEETPTLPSIHDHLPSPYTAKIIVINKTELPRHPLKLDRLPTEVTQQIATGIRNDSTLQALMQSAHHFRDSLSPSSSPVWRDRFLALYDPPFVQNAYQYIFAYKERQFALAHFAEFADEADDRVKVQLQILLDMVRESYRPTQPYLPPSSTSKNLALFAVASSEWMTKFLSAPFLSYGTEDYGKPSARFDALALALAYLLFPPSKYAEIISTARTNYQLSHVYMWDLPFRSLYAKLPNPKSVELSKIAEVVRAHGSIKRIFPNLGVQYLKAKLRSSTPEHSHQRRYNLDLHSLVHIRNFWQRHLNPGRFSKYIFDEDQEHTFHETVQELLRAGYTMPRIPWEEPLLSYSGRAETGLPAALKKLETKFIGFYSPIYPWPKTERKLNELPSSAVDWGTVDPLVLKWHSHSDADVSLPSSTTARPGNQHYWPNIFAHIPCFEDTIPEASEKSHEQVRYLRGAAQFKDLDPSKADLLVNHNPQQGRGDSVDENAQNPADSATGLDNPFVAPQSSSRSSSAAPAASQPQTNGDSSVSLLKNHPYLSLRLRGAIHPLDPLTLAQHIPGLLLNEVEAHKRSGKDDKSETINVPGFHRIVFVLYKPSLTNLIRQLEFASEDYGSTFGVSVTAQMSQATAQVLMNNTATNQFADLPEEAIELLYRHMARLVSDYEEDHGLAPPRTNSRNRKHIDVAHVRKTEKFWTLDRLAQLEDTWYAATDGSKPGWEDIEFAYAYEGIACPGGKILIGRWWRVGENGVGLSPGCEIDILGNAVGPEARKPADEDQSDEDGDLAMADAADTSGAGAAVAHDDDDDNGGEGNSSDRKKKSNAATSASSKAHQKPPAMREHLERGPFFFWAVENEDEKQKPRVALTEQVFMDSVTKMAREATRRETI